MNGGGLFESENECCWCYRWIYWTLPVTSSSRPCVDYQSRRLTRSSSSSLSTIVSRSTKFVSCGSRSANSDQTAMKFRASSPPTRSASHCFQAVFTLHLTRAHELPGLPTVAQRQRENFPKSNTLSAGRSVGGSGLLSDALHSSCPPW